MKKRWKKIMALTLGSALAVTAFTGCGKEDSKETGGAGGDINTVGKSTDFTFLISNAITQGYYDDYDDNPIAQWWTDQEWEQPYLHAGVPGCPASYLYQRGSHCHV